MNILYISHEKDLNGASRSLLGIIDEINKLDVKVHVLIPYKSGKFIEELKKRDVKIIYSKYFRWIITKPKNYIKWIIKKSIFKMLCILNKLTILKVCNYCKKNDIDIIHTNSSVIDIGANISKKSKIPHIYHIREFGEEDFNMYPICNKKKKLKFINDNSETVVAISKALVEKYKYDFDYDKLTLIYNGIDDKFRRFKENKFEDDKKEYNCLIAGRIEEAKGQKEAILAFRELKNKGINNIKLQIVGSGDKRFINELINQNNLQDNIIVKGYSDNLFELRKNIDFELVCSKSEAFGRVTIESMMSSNPVIGANTGGTKELVIDGYNGYLYNVGDYKNLAFNIERIIKDKDKFYQMQVNAYEFSKKFTAENNAMEILKQYRKIKEEKVN